MEETIEMGKYNKGFVLGVFDLFHIGHLNLIRRAKGNCDYLMVGVVIDALPLAVKSVFPVMTFEERFEIVKSIRYVDEAVKIGFENADRRDIWHKYGFDCFFCGDDYEQNRTILRDQKWLRGRGSDLELLPYTKGRTSTDIRRSLVK